MDRAAKRGWLQKTFGQAAEAASRKRKAAFLADSPSSRSSSSHPAGSSKTSSAKTFKVRKKAAGSGKTQRASLRTVPESRKLKQKAWWKAKQSEDVLSWTDAEHDLQHPSIEPDCVRCRYKLMSKSWTSPGGHLGGQTCFKLSLNDSRGCRPGSRMDLNGERR